MTQPKPIRLTGMRQRLLAALQDHITASGGATPTVEDLMSVTGMRSSDAVREQLGWLVEHGYIQHAAGQPAQLRIAAEDGGDG